MLTCEAEGRVKAVESTKKDFAVFYGIKVSERVIITGLTGRILLNDVLPWSNQVPSPPIPCLTLLLCIPLALYFRTEIGHGVIRSCSSGSR